MNGSWTDKSPIDEENPHAGAYRERLLKILIAAVFLLFFQTYMVAPLIPSLADSLGRTREEVGLLVPAYTLPFAFAALACGVLADRFGRRGFLFGSLGAFPLLCVAMALAPNLEGLLALRSLSGMTNAGITVVGLSLIGDLFPPNERGRAIGWVFGSVAGGGAFGSTLGGVLAPAIGWRGLFLGMAAASLAVLLVARPLWPGLATARSSERLGASQAGANYLALLRSPRGARTYAYIVLNGVFHSGIFTWLGVLLHDRYGLGEVGIGLALLGYGVPGLLLGPLIGRVVDRQGRRRIIPLGLAIAALSAYLLAPPLPLFVAFFAITLLSLGFDMSHPLFAGIATTLDEKRRGQAMGLNTFSLFLGFGLGSLVFGGLLRCGMPATIGVFATIQACLAILSISLFRSE